MLISTKGRYALRIMIDLAEHQTDEFISLRGIAQRQEISEKYLESIIRMLVKARVVESLRGKGGGYRLNKSPDQYTVDSILQLTEESQKTVSESLEKGIKNTSVVSALAETLGRYNNITGLADVLF